MSNAYAEFFARGGTITVIPVGRRTTNRRTIRQLLRAETAPRVIPVPVEHRRPRWHHCA